MELHFFAVVILECNFCSSNFLLQLQNNYVARYYFCFVCVFVQVIVYFFVVCLQVRDQDIPVKRNLVRVIVNVDDTNDNAPWFIGTPYAGRVFESAALGTAVLQVTALDKDKGLNAEIVYSIESGTSFCSATCFFFSL